MRSDGADEASIEAPGDGHHTFRRHQALALDDHTGEPLAQAGHPRSASRPVQQLMTCRCGHNRRTSAGLARFIRAITAARSGSGRKRRESDARTSPGSARPAGSSPERRQAASAAACPGSASTSTVRNDGCQTETSLMFSSRTRKSSVRNSKAVGILHAGQFVGSHEQVTGEPALPSAQVVGVVHEAHRDGRLALGARPRVRADAPVLPSEQQSWATHKQRRHPGSQRGLELPLQASRERDQLRSGTRSARRLQDDDRLGGEHIGFSRLDRADEGPQGFVVRDRQPEEILGRAACSDQRRTPAHSAWRTGRASILRNSRRWHRSGHASAARNASVAGRQDASHARFASSGRSRLTATRPRPASSAR